MRHRARPRVIGWTCLVLLQGDSGAPYPDVWNEVAGATGVPTPATVEAVTLSATTGRRRVLTPFMLIRFAPLECGRAAA